MKVLTLGSLFAGIGGFELAATWAGIKPIWSNEIDTWCCKVLRKNFDHEIIEKDIRELNGKTTRNTTSARTSEIGKVFGEREGDKKKSHSKRVCVDDKRGAGESLVLKPVDILTGGFPCQPFSHAGKRKGKDDNRYLWPEYLRLIRELQPSWVIAENVAGLISMENGRTLEGILIDLENENYQTEIYNIPACGVGVWHKRERIWIVAHSNSQSKGHRYNGEGEIFQDTTKTNEGFWKTLSAKKYWNVEPNVGRVANGISRRVDRLKGLGNSIVPQVAYEILKGIVEYEQTELFE